MADRFETQERLIAATREVMVTHGFEGCTLERICAQAGFSRGAFYSNFTDKEDLFTLVARYEYDMTISRVNQVLVQWEAQLEDGRARAEVHQDPRLQMAELLDRALSSLQLDRDYFIIHNEMLVRALRVPAWGRQFQDINREFVDSVAKILDKILIAVGRRFTHSPQAVAQAVIGIVLRATGVDAWHNYDGDCGADTADEGSHGPSRVVRGDGDIHGVIVMMLQACSETIQTSNQQV